MEQRKNELFFALIRSAVCDTKLGEAELLSCKEELLPELLAVSKKQDLGHLLVLGLKRNGIIFQSDAINFEKIMMQAVVRYEQINYDFNQICQVLEKACIPFIPLKGSVLRKYYPEPWMRTSCDIDILVHKKDLNAAIECLVNTLHYQETGRATHDVSLYSPQKIHVELHFDLVEEGRANNAIKELNKVWDNVELCDGFGSKYEMSDEYFYFYHIAHMAKHFETGGCGVRPFLDLWLLDKIDGASQNNRDELLSSAGLLQFANVSRKLSKVWFSNENMDDLSMQMQSFIFNGGLYGSSDNRVAIQQKRKGGKFGYILSRIFVPQAKLKRYYPILEKHPWLMPVMQVRRWFMLLRPDVARMAKREISSNGNIKKSKAEEMNVFLDNIGL